MNNKDVRDAISTANLKYWQVAEGLSMSDCAFSRKLRKEFTAEEKKKALQVIRKLAKEAG